MLRSTAPKAPRKQECSTDNKIRISGTKQDSSPSAGLLSSAGRGSDCASHRWLITFNCGEKQRCSAEGLRIKTTLAWLDTPRQEIHPQTHGGSPIPGLDAPCLHGRGRRRQLRLGHVRRRLSRSDALRAHGPQMDELLEAFSRAERFDLTSVLILNAPQT